mgnify:CR=1 FL=1
MNYLFSLLIFISILFIYIHIYHHYKTSNDLEVYTLEIPNNDKLEEICNIKQPFVFDYKNKELAEMFNIDFLIHKFGDFDINIRDINNHDDEKQLYLPFSLKKSEILLKNDKKNKYITENNSEFIKETGLEKFIEINDEFLKPPLLFNSCYDYVCASENTVTPLRYNVNYRNYIYVTKGVLNLKLICPNDTKYLDKIKDFENFEFRSPINPWNVQKEYKGTFGKVRVLNIEIKKNTMLYIPSYWWYSVKFQKDSSYLMFKYRTYFNNIAILPDLLISFLQKQNIKHNLLKKFEFTTNEESEESPVEKVPVEKVKVEKVPVEKVQVEKVQVEKVQVEKVKVEKVKVEIEEFTEDRIKEDKEEEVELKKEIKEEVKNELFENNNLEIGNLD